MIAKAMLSVPSVTMNGGSLIEVTSSAVEQPEQPRSPAIRRGWPAEGQAEVDGELGHHDAAQRHHHAARQVDAGGEDDQRLADGDDTRPPSPAAGSARSSAPVRKRSVWEAKKMQASSSAMNGPSVDTGGRCSSTRVPRRSRSLRRFSGHRRRPPPAKGPGLARAWSKRCQCITCCPSTRPCRTWCPCCRRRPSACR